ncbi:MAG: glycosyltransferase [Acidobacteriota bacterium]
MACHISVQLCTFNRRELALQCVNALGRVHFPPDACEIVVVDDGSTDHTADALEAAQMPMALQVVRQPHRGLAAARNTGIRAARGEVVLFIDDDTISDANLLAEHWRLHQRHGRLVVMGWVRHGSGAALGPRLPRLADLSTSFFWTSNVSVRRADLFAAGLFDEDFTEYGWEDLELGDRLRALGLKRRRSWRAVVEHVKPSRRASDMPRIIAQAEASGRSAVIYLTKRPGLRTRLTTGLTPARRLVWRMLDGAEPWLHRAIDPDRDRMLGPSERIAAYLVGGIHYHRAARAAMGGRSATRDAKAGSTR